MRPIRQSEMLWKKQVTPIAARLGSSLEETLSVITCFIQIVYLPPILRRVMVATGGGSTVQGVLRVLTKRTCKCRFIFV